MKTQKTSKILKKHIENAEWHDKIWLIVEIAAYCDCSDLAGIFIDYMYEHQNEPDTLYFLSYTISEINFQNRITQHDKLRDILNQLDGSIFDETRCDIDTVFGNIQTILWSKYHDVLI